MSEQEIMLFCDQLTICEGIFVSEDGFVFADYLDGTWDYITTSSILWD